MKAIPAHILVRGRPVCRHPELLIKMGRTPTCGHKSLAAAHREARAIRKHTWGVVVKRGHCPESE